MERITEISAHWFSNPNFQRLLAIAIFTGLILVLSGFVRRTLNKTIKDTARKYKARKATSLLSYLLMLVVVLFIYSDKLGNIGVALGVAGAGIAFALQEVIVSLAGWLNIIIAGKVLVGERVKIGEVKGDIIDIGILTTTIMEIGDWVNGDLYNGRIVTLSNSYIFKEKVHNYSGEFPFLWDEIRIPIRTDSDYVYARQQLTEVLETVCGDFAKESKSKWSEMTNKFRVEEARVDPMVTMSFDENWITFTLRYAVDFKKRRMTKDLIYTQILERIRASNGRITIATTAMEVTNVRPE